MRAFARPGFSRSGFGLGLGRADPQPAQDALVQWWTHGHNNDANRCYQQASSCGQLPGSGSPDTFQPPGLSVLVYRGKAQGRKHYTCSGNVAQGRRSRVCAAREREPWLLATSLPVTRTLARQVVRLYRLRMSMKASDIEKPSVRPGSDLSPCASVERLQVLVFIASLALLVLWLVGTATIAQGAHYQFQANSVRHKRILCSVDLSWACKWSRIPASSLLRRP